MSAFAAGTEDLARHLEAAARTCMCSFQRRPRHCPAAWGLSMNAFCVLACSSLELGHPAPELLAQAAAHTGMYRALISDGAAVRQ